MSNQRIRIPSLDDHYCQVCSTPSTTNNEKRLSCFSCDHCRMSMCYECFERHTNSLIEEYNQIQTHFNQLIIQVENKRQFLATFQEHCLRNVNATFDEILNDLQNLRRESLAYVQQQFNDTEVKLKRKETQTTHFRLSLNEFLDHYGRYCDAYSTDDDQISTILDTRRNFKKCNDRI